MTVYIVVPVIKYEGWEEPCFATTDRGQAEYVALNLKTIYDTEHYQREVIWSDGYEIFELTLCGELT